jgi:hypothetical protein
LFCGFVFRVFADTEDDLPIFVPVVRVPSSVSEFAMVPFVAVARPLPANKHAEAAKAEAKKGAEEDVRRLLHAHPDLFATSKRKFSTMTIETLRDWVTRDYFGDSTTADEINRIRRDHFKSRKQQVAKLVEEFQERKRAIKRDMALQTKQQIRAVNLRPHVRAALLKQSFLAWEFEQSLDDHAHTVQLKRNVR